MLSRELDDEFDLNGRVERKHGHPHRASGVDPRCAEDVAEELGGSVEHAGLAVELRVRRHESDDLHDAGHPIERADHRGDRGERVDGTDAGEQECWLESRIVRWRSGC